MPAIAVTDHGNMFGAYDFWKTGERRRHQADHRHRGVRHAGHAPRRQDARALGQRAGDDDVSGSGAYTHMTLLAETTEGMHNLFRLSSLASIEGYYFKPRMDRELLQTVLARASSPRPAAPAARCRPGCGSASTTRPCKAAAEFRDIFGKRELLRRDHGPRPRHRAPRHGRPAAAREGARPAARRHQRPALHARRTTPTATRRCCACSPARRSTTRTASSSTPTSSTSRPPAEMRAALPRPPRGVRQHAAHRRALRGRVRHERELHAALPGARRARPRSAGSSRRSSAACTSATPAASPTTCARRPSTRPTSSLQMGFPGYFLVVADFINWAKEQRHPGRPGPRFGRRLDGRLRDADHRPRPAAARADLRALPQPRARLDARLRRRLRRASPRRGHPVRHREVRRRARRPDRHLRHDQGQAGAEGRRPRARLPVRDGREAHQGDAAAGHGQGHAARAASSTRTHPRYKEAADFRALIETDAEAKTVFETALGHREPEAPVGRARGRRHHVERAAHRHHPDHEARAGRRRSSRSSTTRRARRSA